MGRRGVFSASAALIISTTTSMVPLGVAYLEEEEGE